jgi:hemerythrin
MQFLEWKETYEIGVKEIDIQHRGLFDIISKLSTTNRYDTEGKYFFATLNRLLEYAKIHFATEERYMLEAQYPKLADHQKEHAQFVVDVLNLAKGLSKKEPDIERKILDFLKNWYTAHIIGTDRDYQQTLIEKGFK